MDNPQFSKKNRFYILISFFLLVVIVLTSSVVTFQNRQIVNTKATENLTITVCSQPGEGCDYPLDTDFHEDDNAFAIQQAITTAPKGSTIIMKAGVYQRKNYEEITQASGDKRKCAIVVGADEKRITLKGSGEVLLTGKDSLPMNGICIVDSKVTIDSINVSGFKKDPDSCFENQKTSPCSRGDGILATNTTNALITNSDIAENDRIGIIVDVTARVTIQNNDIHDNATRGIFTSEKANTSIYNNRIFNNQEFGLYVAGNNEGSINAVIVNNTFYGNKAAGLSILQANNARVTLKVQNNIFAKTIKNEDGKQGVGVLRVGNSSDWTPLFKTTFDHNLFWENEGGCAYDDNLCSIGDSLPSSNPQFVNVESNDFRLCTGLDLPVRGCTEKSQAVNKGNPNTLVLDDNKTRNDIGAYGGPKTPTIPLYTKASAVFVNKLLPKPAYRVKMSKNILGTLTQYTTLTRISADPSTSLPGYPECKWSKEFARHRYSLEQPWNADQRLLLIFNRNVPAHCPNRIFLDGNTYEVKFGFTNDTPKTTDPRWKKLITNDIRWHPSIPNTFIYTTRNELHSYNVVTQKDRLIQKFLEYKDTEDTDEIALTGGITLGPSKGNISNDGKYILIVGRTVETPESPISYAEAFIFDLKTKTKYEAKRLGTSNIIFREVEDDDTDAADGNTWVSMSPSGKYVVVKAGLDLTLQTPGTEVTIPVGQIAVFDLSWNWINTLPRRAGHSDMIYNSITGEDWIVGNTFELPKGRVFGAELKSARTEAQLVYFTNEAQGQAHHVSCRNINRPRWCYISFKPGDGNKPFDDEIVSIKIFGSDKGSVERWGKTHISLFAVCQSSNNPPGCNKNNAQRQAQAVPSPDGKRVLFGSNWGRGTDIVYPMQDYVIDARIMGSSQ